MFFVVIVLGNIFNEHRLNLLADLSPCTLAASSIIIII